MLSNEILFLYIIVHKVILFEGFAAIKFVRFKEGKFRIQLYPKPIRLYFLT